MPAESCILNPKTIVLMIKHKLIMLAICTLGSSLVAHAQRKPVLAAPMPIEAGISKIVKDQGDGKVLYGYCDPDFKITAKTGVGFNTDEDLGVNAAIRLSEGMTSLLKGRKIHRLKIGVAQDMHATIFIRKTDGTPLKEIEQDLVLGWNNVVLDTPLDIPAEKELYIGYSCIQHPKEFVIGVENSTSRANGMFIGTENTSLVEYSGMGNLCILAEVDGTESDFEFAGSIVSVYASKPYMCEGAGESSEITLNFLNEGEKNVSTIKLGRTFNGTELGDTLCAFKRTLRANSVGELTFQVTPPESGKYVFTLKEMGETPVKASAKPAQFSFYKSENVVPRNVLMEEFTSQKCGNCPSGQKALHELTTGHEDRVVMVLHHSGFYPDDFSIAESDSYCYFYNSASTYAPAMTMDRTYFTELDAEGNGGTVFDPRRLSEARFTKQLELPAMVSVGIKSAYDEATRKLTVTVSGYKITDLIGDHVGLTVFLLESKYIANQSGGSANFEHNNFPRCVLSAVDGDILTFNGNGYSKEYTYTIPESYVSTTSAKTNAHPENMHIAAFVSNFDYKHPDNCAVLNANKTASLNDIVTGIETEKAPEQDIRVFAQDDRICVEGEYQAISVYTIQGMPIPNGNLAAGIYLVKVTGRDGKTSVKKILM